MIAPAVHNDLDQLRAAIVALEGQRAALGDAVVDAALGPLRDRLAALAGRAQPAQQRKQATILFADVSGFTALSETMDAEEVAGVMNDLWQLVDRAILEHGGRIDKHIGDAVMALWGVEQAREDDPERAVRAALAMQTAVDAFCQTHHAPLALRIGVNTGLVLVGQVGTTGEFTVMGDAVNVASRLEHAAPVGGILISHDTYRHVRGVFDVQPLDELPVRGKASSLRCYVILRAKPRAFRTATRGIEDVETRTIGRDAELLTLQNAFSDSLDDSQARIVLVSGEAGVGKSRLLYEFENWLELRPERISFHKGRAVPGGARTRLGLLRDQFAMRFDILESDPADVALDKFRRGMLPTLGADQADVVGHWLGFDFGGSPAVARLAGQREFALTAQAHLFRTLRDLSRERPVVIFYEDIHWADEASLDLILELAAALADCRLLIVCLARPVLHERRPNWGEGHPALSRLELRPLSRRQTRELVREVLQRMPAVPDTLRDLLVDNAEGNPFYVEELVKMLIEQGVIERKGADEQVSGDAVEQESAIDVSTPTPLPLGSPMPETWRVREEKLADLRVPPTLTGVLQARLDALPADERETLQRSAVVGRLFWDATVAELAGVTPEEVRETLGSIRARDLIFHRNRSSFSGAEEYAFRHNLLREVVYETVLLRARRDYHGRVARWIEAHAGERLGEFLSLIAEHYALAGANGVAASYFERAGQQALDAGTYRPARAAYEHALALRQAAGETVGAVAETQIKLGAACWQLGEYQTARELLEQGLDGARRAGNGRAEAEGLYYLGMAVASQGEYQAAKELFEKALPIARSLGGAALVEVLFGLGSTAWRLGDLDAAEAYAREELTLARTLGGVGLEAQAVNMLGLIAGARADLPAEKACYEEALALSRQSGDLFREAVAVANLGVIAILGHDYHEAIGYLDAAIEKFTDLGRRESVALNLGNLAHAHLMLGQAATAREHVRDMLRLSRQLGAMPRVLDALLNLAEILITEGETARGLHLIGLIRGHPAGEFQMQQEIDRILDGVAVEPAEMEAALAHGAALDMEEVTRQILAESQ